MFSDIYDELYDTMQERYEALQKDLLNLATCYVDSFEDYGGDSDVLRLAKELIVKYEKKD